MAVSGTACYIEKCCSVSGDLDTFERPDIQRRRLVSTLSSTARWLFLAVVSVCTCRVCVMKDAVRLYKHAALVSVARSRPRVYLAK